MESITRHYELVLMFDINQDESMTASTLDKYKSVITENSGSIHRFEDWGIMKLDSQGVMVISFIVSFYQIYRLL